MTYLTKILTSSILNTESSYDWENEQWSIPINGTVSQMLKIGGAPLSVFVGIRYWTDSPETGPDDFGFHLNQVAKTLANSLKKYPMGWFMRIVYAYIIQKKEKPMEHHVIIEKLCSCAKKEGLNQIVSFETKESAKNAADVQLAFINNNFCGKHNFDMTEVDDHFVIGMLAGGCGCGTHEKH